MAAKCSEDTKEALTYTALLGESSSKWGGYRRELITEKLSLLEENLVVCSKCTGIMRDACSIKGGLAQVCEGCLGDEKLPQPVGPIRTTVAKLACRCPLKQRGCEWEGTMGEVDNHLDECNQFVVRCPFVKYGCRKELKRGELEMHRKEAKEYHTEVVSVFMANKVEKLEEEKKEQTKIIEKLQSALGDFLLVKDYIKINGISWTIINRYTIINKIYQLQGRPHNAVPTPAQDVQNHVTYNGDAYYSHWNGNYLDGPRFLIHSYYYLYPRITFQNNNRANFAIHSYNLGNCDNSIIWPLRGRCTIILVNQKDKNDPWVHEMNNFSITLGGSVNITTLPYDVLLDEKYQKDNTLEMKILIKTHP